MKWKKDTVTAVTMKWKEERHTDCCYHEMEGRKKDTVTADPVRKTRQLLLT